MCEGGGGGSGTPPPREFADIFNSFDKIYLVLSSSFQDPLFCQTYCRQKLYLFAEEFQELSQCKTFSHFFPHKKYLILCVC